LNQGEYPKPFLKMWPRIIKKARTLIFYTKKLTFLMGPQGPFNPPKEEFGTQELINPQINKNKKN